MNIPASFFVIPQLSFFLKVNKISPNSILFCPLNKGGLSWMRSFATKEVKFNVWITDHISMLALTLWMVLCLKRMKGIRTFLSFQDTIFIKKKSVKKWFCSSVCFLYYLLLHLLICWFIPLFPKFLYRFLSEPSNDWSESQSFGFLSSSSAFVL